MLPPQVDVNEFFQHPVPLGANLYDKGRAEVKLPVRKSDAAAAAATTAGKGSAAPGPEEDRPTVGWRPKHLKLQPCLQNPPKTNIPKKAGIGSGRGGSALGNAK